MYVTTKVFNWQGADSDHSYCWLLWIQLLKFVLILGFVLPRGILPHTHVGPKKNYPLNNMEWLKGLKFWLIEIFVSTIHAMYTDTRSYWYRLAKINKLGNQREAIFWLTSLSYGFDGTKAWQFEINSQFLHCPIGYLLRSCRKMLLELANFQEILVLIKIKNYKRIGLHNSW